MEVKKAKREADQRVDEIKTIMEQLGEEIRIWNEFDTSLVQVKEIELKYRKIAGVSIPEPDNILFEDIQFDVFSNPKWFTDGIEIIRNLIRLEVEKRLLDDKVKILEYARKKTTQKVNLYEKVQIPGYESAIRKIKRFLEDEENLAKAAQKIVKNRQQKEMTAEL